MPKLAKAIEFEVLGPLVREDLARLYEPRAVTNRPKKLRHSHHNVAMLIACGYTFDQIKTLTGYSHTRITTLRGDPAFEALIQTYEGRIDKEIAAKSQDFILTKMDLMVTADRHIKDRLEELDENDELLPLRDAIKISTEMADRVGYGKHSFQHNYNRNYASTLEERVRRRNAPTGPEPEPVSGTVVPLVIQRRLP